MFKRDIIILVSAMCQLINLIYTDINAKVTLSVILSGCYTFAAEPIWIDFGTDIAEGPVKGHKLLLLLYDIHMGWAARKCTRMTQIVQTH